MRDRVLVALTLVSVCCVPATGAGTAVDTAIAVFQDVIRDKTKLAAFCEMSRLMSEENDLPKDDAVYRKIDIDMNTLGPEFQQAWNLGAELEPDSAAEKAYDSAMGALEGKCDK